MGLVNKKEALRNMSNPKDFDVFKARFLKVYKDVSKKINDLYNDNAFDEMLELVTSINKISLSVGSQFLFNETLAVIDKINNDSLQVSDIESLNEIIDGVYQELQFIK